MYTSISIPFHIAHSILLPDVNMKKVRSFPKCRRKVWKILRNMIYVCGLLACTNCLYGVVAQAHIHNFMEPRITNLKYDDFANNHNIAQTNIPDFCHIITTDTGIIALVYLWLAEMNQSYIRVQYTYYRIDSEFSSYIYHTHKLCSPCYNKCFPAEEKYRGMIEVKIN